MVQLKGIRKLTDHEKHFLLTKHFIPTRNYKFPARFIGGRNRHFQHSWLDQYNGLVYSESEDGGYCKYCALFAREAPTLELGVLVNRPLIDFKRATEKIHDHFCSKKFHKEAVEAAAAFTAVMKNPDLAIDHRLSSERSKRAVEYRRKLLSIAETIIFCGRQGLAFRGHRDDASTKKDSSTNQGNFLALLHFRAQAGDKVLEEHLKTAAGNAMYISKTIQNQMITVCGDIIRKKILEMIRKVGFFSVIADEATDTANDEQLSRFCVRYLYLVRSFLLSMSASQESRAKHWLITLSPNLLSGSCNLSFFVDKHMMGQGQWLEKQKVLPFVYLASTPRLCTRIVLLTD